MAKPFATPIEETKTESGAAALAGPWRRPRQMLAAQSYDSHASIHDDATAQKLGFKGGTIEGPTHFSQFVPLCVSVWGARWLEQGCLSAHYRNACYDGDEVRAFLFEAGGRRDPDHALDAPQGRNRGAARHGLRRQRQSALRIGSASHGARSPSTSPSSCAT